MSVLEIVAEKHLGKRTLLKRPKLRVALRRIEGSVAHQSEWERIASIVDLCFEFDRETDPEEKENILRTLEEISTNRPLELPIEGIEEWEQKLKATNLGYARADAAASKKTGAFLKAYFSLRARRDLRLKPMSPASRACPAATSRSSNPANTSRNKKPCKNLPGHSEWMLRP